MACQRRQFLKASTAALAAAAGFGRFACAGTPDGAPKVVVVGGGYGGATAAKYIRNWSDGKIAVTLVERDIQFVSCPLSNLVLGGSRQLADITVPYSGLDRWGVRRIRGEAVAVDTAARKLIVAG